MSSGDQIAMEIRQPSLGRRHDGLREHIHSWETRSLAHAPAQSAPVTTATDTADRLTASNHSARLHAFPARPLRLLGLTPAARGLRHGQERQTADHH
jgi:hypothetical protein